MIALNLMKNPMIELPIRILIKLIMVMVTPNGGYDVGMTSWYLPISIKQFERAEFRSV